MRIQPRKRLRQRHQEVVQLRRQRQKFVLIPYIHQQKEVFIRSLVYQLVHCRRERGLKEQFLLLFVTHADKRVYAHLLEVAADDALTE